MEDAPYVDVMFLLDVENKVRVTGQGPEAQAGQIQFMGVTWRACGWVAADVRIG